MPTSNNYYRTPGQSWEARHDIAAQEDTAIPNKQQNSKESPTNYPNLVRLAVGPEATLVPFAGTEGVRDLPDALQIPHPWMECMLP